MFCISKALDFVSNKEHQCMVAAWITEGKITVEDVELKCKLTTDHKYKIIQSIYASPHFDNDEKRKLRDKCFENDKSDRAQTIMKICDYSMPSAELKEKLWSEMTDPESQDTLQATK